jgi:hypothetical protein
MNDDAVPPIDPDEPLGEPPPQPVSPPPDDFTPLSESSGSRFVEAAGRGCLGTVTFVLALALFGTAVVAKPPIGLVFSILVVVGLFAVRRRSGPSPMLGAVAVGATIAMILAGACAIVMMSYR